MMMAGVLKNNEAVVLKDEDLEQVTGGQSTDMAQGNIDFVIFERDRLSI